MATSAQSDKRHIQILCSGHDHIFFFNQFLFTIQSSHRILRWLQMPFWLSPYLPVLVFHRATKIPSIEFGFCFSCRRTSLPGRRHSNIILTQNHAFIFNTSSPPNFQNKSRHSLYPIRYFYWYCRNPLSSVIFIQKTYAVTQKIPSLFTTLTDLTPQAQQAFLKTLEEPPCKLPNLSGYPFPDQSYPPSCRVQILTSPHTTYSSHRTNLTYSQDLFQKLFQWE